MFSRGSFFYLGIGGFLSLPVGKPIGGEKIQEGSSESRKLLPFSPRPGQWGYLDRQGNIAIDSKFSYANEFFKGWAPVEVAVNGLDKKGLIDLDGQWLVPPVYDYVFCLTEKLAFLGRKILNNLYTCHMVSRENVFLAKRPNIASVQAAENTDNAIAPFRGIVVEDWWIYSKDGNRISCPENKIHQYRAPGEVSFAYPKIWKTYYFNEAFQTVGEKAFEQGTIFFNGLAGVLQGKTFFLINNEGYPEVGTPSSHVHGLNPSMNGSFFEVKVGHSWGLIDRTGHWSVPCCFQELGCFAENLAPAKIQGKKWGYIDQYGNFQIPQTFSHAGPFSEGLASVQSSENGLWGFVDPNGAWAIKPTYASNRQISCFHQGLVPVRLGTRYGYIDRRGELKIPFIFSQAREFFDGLAQVEIDGAVTYVDCEGRLIWKP